MAIKVVIHTADETEAQEILETMNSVIKDKRYKVRRRYSKAKGKKNVVTQIDIISRLQ